jgi:uncharacterized protein YhfF
MPPPDRAALAVFVQDFAEATGLGVTSEPFCFGDSPQLADELAALVRCGLKRATATTVVEFEHEGVPLPTIGQHSVVYDGIGQPVCVIRTDDLSVGSLDEVLDPAFAWDDGEGDRSYEDWLAQHAVYWRRVLPNVRRRVQPRTWVWCSSASLLSGRSGTKRRFWRRARTPTCARFGLRIGTGSRTRCGSAGTAWSFPAARFWSRRVCRHWLRWIGAGFG